MYDPPRQIGLHDLPDEVLSLICAFGYHKTYGIVNRESSSRSDYVSYLDEPNTEGIRFGPGAEVYISPIQNLSKTIYDILREYKLREGDGVGRFSSDYGDYGPRI